MAAYAILATKTTINLLIHRNQKLFTKLTFSTNILCKESCGIKAFFEYEKWYFF